MHTGALSCLTGPILAPCIPYPTVTVHGCGDRRETGDKRDIWSGYELSSYCDTSSPDSSVGSSDCFFPVWLWARQTKRLTCQTNCEQTAGRRSDYKTLWKGEISDWVCNSIAPYRHWVCLFHVTTSQQTSTCDVCCPTHGFLSSGGLVKSW